MSAHKGFFIKIVFLFFTNFFYINILAGQDNSYEKKIEYLTEKARNYAWTNQDSVYLYFERIRDLASSKNDWQNVAQALIRTNRVANYYYDLGKISKNLTILDSLFAEQQNYFENLKNIRSLNIALLFDKGSYYYLLQDFQKSRKAFNEIVSSVENIPDSLVTSSDQDYSSVALSYIGKMYGDEGKYEQAKQYYGKNIRLLDTKKRDTLMLNEFYALLAEIFKKEKNYQQANEYLLKTLDYNVKNKTHGSIPAILNIVQNHNNLAQIDSAEYYLKIANDLLGKDDPSLSSFYQVQAETLQKKGSYHEALSAFEVALALIRNKWNNERHWEVAHVLNKIGLLQTEFSKPTEAAGSFLQSFEQIINSKTGIDRIKKVQILKNKAKALNLIGSEAHLTDVINSVNLGMAILDTLKPSFKSHSDKLFLIEDVFPLFESGLEAAFNLYQYSNDEKYIETAFKYSEESKAVLLLEALLGAKATEFANIPAALVERESQLKSQITFTERKINMAKTSDESLLDDLFDLKEEYRQMVDSIETNYEAYYNLKYNTATVSLTAMQTELKPNEKLISYFYGNAAIYAIAVSKNDKQLEKIPMDNELESKIIEVHRMLADSKSDIGELGKASHHLYNILLEPFLEPNVNRLTIITDGLLNYIPFSALNTVPDGLDYLAERCAVSYSNSATLLSELRLRKPKTPNVLALAPSFNGSSEVNISRSLLMPLPHNKPEVAKVLTAFDGHSLLDEEASLQNFKKEFDKFGVLHLATHAVFNDSLPEYSYLAFSQNEHNNNEDLLFVADLYNLKTDADLVALSACESGIGELRRGEGFMGLSRGFFYGGAASIASTLWKINDASSADLMGLFYENLANGDTKDKALQKAQRAFLKTNSQNALVHPYYWSGFIISGNTMPLAEKTNWIWIIAGCILIFGLGFYFYREKNYSNSLRSSKARSLL